jgi:hypothetical protein
MTFTLDMLIAAYLPGDREFADGAHRWFTSCTEDLFEGYFDPYRTGRKREIEDGHLLKSQFRVNPDLHDMCKSSIVWLPYSRTWFDRLRTEVEKRPHSVAMMTGRMRTHDGPQRRVAACDADLTSVRTGYDDYARDSGWVQLTASFVHDIPDSGEQRAVYDRWTAFLGEAMTWLGADYGHIARHRRADQMSALESEIRKPSISRRSAVLGGYCLRGYEWVTACGPAVAARLGGADRIRGTGAFFDVRELGHGGMLMRATPTIEDLNEAALHRIYPVLAPMLLPGRPTVHPHEKFNKWGPMPVIYGLDAADHGSTVPAQLDPDGIGLG